MSESIYGVLADFSSEDALLKAVHTLRESSGLVLEAYTPYPVEGLAAALGIRRNRVPLWTLIGGIFGGVAGYAMQWYATTVAYPINVGGRPDHSWPLFVPVAFELVILCATLAAVAGMLIGNGLPRLRHPVFGVARFDLASRNRFFLCVRAGSNPFRPDAVAQQLVDLGALTVSRVPQ